MKKTFKESYKRFQNLDGEKYNVLPTEGEFGRSFVVQIIRKQDSQPCILQLFPEGNGYFIYLPESESPYWDSHKKRIEP